MSVEINLIEGKYEKPHVTSDDARTEHAVMFGRGRKVLSIDREFEAVSQGNNTIRILSGVLYNNGAFIRINRDDYREVTFENCVGGTYRNDLICIRYAIDINTGVEAAYLVVKKGVPSETVAQDPAYISGDILDLETHVDEFPLYRIKLYGPQLTLEPMFEVADVMDNITMYRELVAHLQDTENPHQVTKEQVGLGNVDNTADTDKPLSNVVRNVINELKTDILSKAPAEHNHSDYALKNSPIFEGSISMGRKAGTAVGNSSVAVGLEVTGIGTACHAEGESTIARTTGSHAEGKSTEAGNPNRPNESSYAHAEGDSSKAYGRGSHAEGESTLAQGKYAHAEGGGCEATGDYSHVEGCNSGYTKTKATKIGAHAEGRGTTASGEGSHSEGCETTASGQYSHAQGYKTTAGNAGTHAEGRESVADGPVAHAEGFATFSHGQAAHAEGHRAVAGNGNAPMITPLEDFPEGAGSHAENIETWAKGRAAHTEGYATIATGDCQHVQGKFNVEDTEEKYAHIVGGGTSDSNRKNIHTIDWDGNAEFAGDVTATDADGNKVSLLTKAGNLINIYNKEIQWKSEVGNLPGSFYDIAYGSGKFVAVSAYGVFYSDDGINWKYEEANGLSCTYKRIIYGKDKFIAISKSDSTGIAYSFDGISWAELKSVTTHSINDIAYADYFNGLFIAVEEDGHSSYSYDGIVWNQGGKMLVATPSGLQGISMNSVTSDGTGFTAIGKNGEIFNVIGSDSMLDSDGRWTFCEVLETSAETDYRILQGNDTLVITVDKSVYYKDIAGDFVLATTLPETIEDIVYYGNNRFIAITDTTTYISMDNGITWNKSANTFVLQRAVAYGNDKLAVVGDGSYFSYASLINETKTAEEAINELYELVRNLRS